MSGRWSDARTAALGNGLIGLLALAMITALLLHGPLPQDPNYHRFADSRPLLGLPNGLNLLSNLAFVLVGVLGLRDLAAGRLFCADQSHAALTLLFGGVALVGLGSSWYHLQPDNTTLVWDRLPMTLGFMGLVSLVITDRVSLRLGQTLLVPLLLIGLASVLWWHWSELQGRGDLRPYLLVQFLPMAALPVLLLTRPSGCAPARGYWWLLGAYALAKLFEALDAEVFALTGEWISGHTLKHLCAALGIWLLLVSLRRARPAGA